eukprot:4628940-Pleurochrysis_carterae.AAC.1
MAPALSQIPTLTASRTLRQNTHAAPFPLARGVPAMPPPRAEPRPLAATGRTLLRSTLSFADLRLTPATQTLQKMILVLAKMPSSTPPALTFTSLPACASTATTTAVNHPCRVPRQRVRLRATATGRQFV